MGHRAPSRALLPGAADRHAGTTPQRDGGSRWSSRGVDVEVHHHEVGAMARTRSARVLRLVQRADWMQIYKYTIVERGAVVRQDGGPSCPSRSLADNGSGMHVHQSVWKGGKNLFAGNGYAGLSISPVYTSAASSSTPPPSTPSPIRHELV